MRWAVLLSILVLVAGAVPAMGAPAEMSKKPASEKPFMHAGGGIGAPHERASIQVPKPEKKSEVEEKLFNKTKERLLNWTEKCENWISRMEEKITTLNMSDEAKARIEKRAEDAKKMVEEMKSKIENAENLADLRNATKDARILWTNLSKEMRLIAFEREVYQLEKMIERMKEIAGKLKEKGGRYLRA
jgi:lysyl-tRNA synthetase class I